MRPIRRYTSSSASRRNVCAVFFELFQRAFIINHWHRTESADLFVGGNNLLAQLNKGLVALHLVLHLFQFRSQGEIAGVSLSANAGIPQILRAVAGMILLGTSAVALAALAKITEILPRRKSPRSSSWR